MSPSQWFKGKDDPQGTDDKTDNNEVTVAQYTDSLNAVAQGLAPSAKDIEHLQKLVPSSNPEEQAVLKSAYGGHLLDPQQKAIIKQITAKL
jgi:hypothetical protein